MGFVRVHHSCLWEFFETSCTFFYLETRVSRHILVHQHVTRTECLLLLRSISLWSAWKIKAQKKKDSSNQAGKKRCVSSWGDVQWLVSFTSPPYCHNDTWPDVDPGGNWGSVAARTKYRVKVVASWQLLNLPHMLRPFLHSCAETQMHKHRVMGWGAARWD